MDAVAVGAVAPVVGARVFVIATGRHERAFTSEFVALVVGAKVEVLALGLEDAQPGVRIAFVKRADGVVVAFDRQFVDDFARDRVAVVRRAFVVVVGIDRDVLAFAAFKVTAVDGAGIQVIGALRPVHASGYRVAVVDRARGSVVAIDGLHEAVSGRRVAQIFRARVAVAAVARRIDAAALILVAVVGAASDFAGASCRRCRPKPVV